MAHPVVGRQRVGAGVGDEAQRVEPDDAVARAGARVGADDGRAGREGAVGDHLAQIRGTAQVGDLQRAGHAGHREVRVAGEHRDHRAVVAHRDRLRADRHLQVPVRLLVAADPALDDGPPQLGPRPGGDAHADGVLGMRRRTGGGARLGHAEERVRRSGIQSRKSANDMSASSCHSATTRCRCSTVPPDSSVCSASSSLSVDTSRPPPRALSPSNHVRRWRQTASSRAEGGTPCRSEPASGATGTRRAPTTARSPTPEPSHPQRRAAWVSAPPLDAGGAHLDRGVGGAVGVSATVTCACSQHRDPDLLAQRRGRLLPAALRGQQPLQLLVEAVLGQAGRALVEVLGQTAPAVRGRTRCRGTARPRRAPRCSRSRGVRRSS